MNDYLDLADALVQAANSGNIDEALIRQAAAVICVQVARVAALEQQLEKRLVQVAEMRLQLDYYGREATTFQRTD